MVMMVDVAAAAVVAAAVVADFSDRQEQICGSCAAEADPTNEPGWAAVVAFVVTPVVVVAADAVAVAAEAPVAPVGEDL